MIAIPLGFPNRHTTATRVIAVNIPNIQGIRTTPWTNYLASVNVIQANSGFTFFTALPANVAGVLRAKIDGSTNQPATPPGFQSIHFAAGQISLVVTGAVAANYTITATTNLANPQWVTLLTTNSPAKPLRLWMPAPPWPNGFIACKRGRDGSEKARRADIFVVWRFKK
ncbi:MAG TPA: hypothetical protein VFC17_02015 [Candidatus Limnocylindrales bacterium]|nr:hypothetical protein [Candidatus Limnocylindrales bacterium]